MEVNEKSRSILAPGGWNGYTATIKFEAKLWLTADTAMLPREAILRSLSEAKET